MGRHFWEDEGKARGLVLVLGGARGERRGERKGMARHVAFATAGAALEGTTATRGFHWTKTESIEISL